jgi:replication initiation protein RepC
MSLERRQQEARERLENQLAEAAQVLGKAVDSDPMGPENRPHQYNYKATLYPEQDTVMASEESRSGAARSAFNDRASVRRQEPDRGKAEAKERTDSGTVMRLKPDELVRLAPRLRAYLATSSPAWPDIVEAADWLRHDLKVSKPLWGDACLAMGREKAAIALAIVSAKPESHFTASPGSYFHGMVKRAQAGQLNLARTIWGLRDKPRAATASSSAIKGEFWNSRNSLT